MNRSPGDKVNGGGPAHAERPAARGAPGELPAGTVLGKYRIVKRLAGGGMGAVYEAVHTGIAKPVALKTMSPSLATDPRSTTRFLREAAAASRLEHPHVVDVTDFGNDENISYLVMELLRGEDLGSVIARERRGMDPAFVADILLAVCAGVFAAHESGVIHRDLKPGNIFLAKTPLGEVVPKVLDFGISKRIDDDLKSGLTNSGAVMGTTHYLSPEQVSGKTLDVRSDQYSLGVIMYEAIIGKKPHDGQSVYAIMQSIGEGRHALPRTLRPDIPPPLEAVILRAMSLRPQSRFESVHDLGRALLPFATGKRRVMWSDYYDRDRPPVTSPPAGLDRGPLPAVGAQGQTPQDGATVAIDSFRPAAVPLTRTRTHRSGSVPRPPEQEARRAPARPARPSDDTGREVFPVPVIGTDEYLRTTPALRRGGPRFLAVVVLGLLAAGAYVFWIDPSWRDRLPESLRTRIDRTLSTRPAPTGEVAPAGEDPTGVAGVAVPREDPAPPGGLGGPEPTVQAGGLTRDPTTGAAPAVAAPTVASTPSPDSQPAAVATAPGVPTPGASTATPPAVASGTPGTPAGAPPVAAPGGAALAPPPAPAGPAAGAPAGAPASAAVAEPAPRPGVSPSRAPAVTSYRRKHREPPPIRTAPPVRPAPPLAAQPTPTVPPPPPPQQEPEPASPPPGLPPRPVVPVSPSPILE